MLQRREGEKRKMSENCLGIIDLPSHRSSRDFLFLFLLHFQVIPSQNFLRWFRELILCTARP